MTHEIEIEPLPVTTGTSRGAWRVWFNGAVLIERARDPEFAACRELAARGLSGEMLSRHKGSQTPCIRVQVENGSQLSTQEGEAARVRIGKWVPRIDFEVDE